MSLGLRQLLVACGRFHVEHVLRQVEDIYVSSVSLPYQHALAGHLV